jgi:hypothetical protein
MLDVGINDRLGTLRIDRLYAPKARAGSDLVP